MLGFVPTNNGKLSSDPRSDPLKIMTNYLATHTHPSSYIYTNLFHLYCDDFDGSVWWNKQYTTSKLRSPKQSILE